MLLPVNACTTNLQPIEQMDDEKIRTLMRTDSYEEKYFQAAELCLHLFKRKTNIPEDSIFLKNTVHKIILYNNLNSPNVNHFNFKELNTIDAACTVETSETESEKSRIIKFRKHIDNRTKDIAALLHNLRQNSLQLLKSRHDASSLSSVLNQDILGIIMRLGEELKFELEQTYVDISCQGGGCNEL